MKKAIATAAFLVSFLAIAAKQLIRITADP